MRRFGQAALIATGLCLGMTAAHAQDLTSASGSQYDFGLGIGALAKPKYPGADDYIVVPYPIFAAGRLYVPFIGQTESKTSGFYFYPSFGVNGERKPSDDKSLKGTKKVPWALDLGVGAGVRQGIFQGYGSIRQGVTGHEGQTGEFGFNLVLPASPRVEVAFGPKATWGSEDYMDTYFGVTGAEAAAGSLKKYDPSGGIISAGLNLRTTYRWTETTSLHVRANWDRLVGEAADSPIVKAGSKDQWSVGVGISRRFDFNLFR